MAARRIQLWQLLALVYLVAAKMSSNFFLSTCPSASGQLDSSWCTKITFSSTAYGTAKPESTPRVSLL